MDDPEIERLAVAETADRLARVSQTAQCNLERLACSLTDLADALDELSAARNPNSDRNKARRAAFQRAECPGRPG